MSEEQRIRYRGAKVQILRAMELHQNVGTKDSGLFLVHAMLEASVISGFSTGLQMTKDFDIESGENCGPLTIAG